MTTLHLANIAFEFELAQHQQISLRQWMRHSAITRHLQYLPLAYAAKGDVIAVSDMPPNVEDRRLQDLKEVGGRFDTLRVWGVTASVYEWLSTQCIEHALPDPACVKRVNSKAYSFEHGEPLVGALLLESREAAERWLSTLTRPQLLKAVFGVAGRGMSRVKPEGRLPSWLDKEFLAGRPVLAEPWVPREIDFSTQWELSRQGDIQLVGYTTMENSPGGTYRSTLVGGEAPPMYERHLQAAERLLQKMSVDGYFGPVGVDAMIYIDGGRHLAPVVEVNARLTMARIALDVYQQRKMSGPRRFAYGPAEKGLLPRGTTDWNWQMISNSRINFK